MAFFIWEGGKESNGAPAFILIWDSYDLESSLDKTLLDSITIKLGKDCVNNGRYLATSHLYQSSNNLTDGEKSLVINEITYNFNPDIFIDKAKWLDPVNYSL